MESQVVKRRINTISGHLAARIVTEDVNAPNTHLFPLNCSSNLNTSFKRLDSRMLYGRQASASQGYFMRQAMSSTDKGNLVARSGVCSAKCVNEAKTTAPERPSYARPASSEPLFSRPVQEDFNCNHICEAETFKQDKALPASKCPTSVLPQEKQVSRRQMFSSQINGIGTGWSPRINVIESKSSHVITVELPGVEINDIRVEMDDKNLIVRGIRSMKWWKIAGCPNDSLATYHRREIAQGPYKIIWPLPPGADKNSVSAELVEGILHITIPKL